MSRYDHIQEVQKSRYDVIQEITKFNPYHGPDGRFSSANGAASFTYKPGQGKMYDNAIAREKARTAAAATVAGTPKKGLVAGLGEKHARAIEKLIHENAPNEVQDVWDKYGDKISVATATHNGTAHCDSRGYIHVNIAEDSADKDIPYETTLHESGHNIDRAIARAIGTYEVGSRISMVYKDGAFEKSLISESNAYFKRKQAEYSAARGRKMTIADTRKAVSWEMFRNGGYKVTGDVSDILGGATKGKFVGSAGHSKNYWTGTKDYYGRSIGAHSVAVEAFAEMFSASTTNHKSLGQIKEIFPESYKLFIEMCAHGATIQTD